MIQVENVTKKYGSFVAVNKINFEIEEGEIVGFLGPNGAGKSTTMNMITGFIEPTKGKIIVDGYDMSKKPKKAKKQIGYMPEGVPLYSDLTVKEFVTYMAEIKGVDKKEKKEKVAKVLEQIGLTDVQNKLTKNLSRGYKQRVSMAGALVGNPKVIILDRYDMYFEAYEDVLEKWRDKAIVLVDSKYCNYSYVVPQDDDMVRIEMTETSITVDRY